MRKLVLFFICMLPLTSGIFSHAQSVGAQDNVEKQDSTVDVIGWFLKNDSVDYWIQEGRWKVTGNDTVLTAGVSTKVRIVVTDSTSNGYKMDYTFLKFVPDTLAKSGAGRFMNKLVEKFGNKIVGTTVHFDTDEYGKITKIHNLGQIKKQVKSLYKNMALELESIKELKKAGVDIKKIMKEIDPDEMVDDYLEELKLLFAFHGTSLILGEFKEHNDATGTTYENDTYNENYLEPDNGEYGTFTKVVSIIPKETVKAMVGGLVEEFTGDKLDDEKRNEFNKIMNEALKENATCEDAISIDYHPSGWPLKVLKSSETKIGNIIKSQQTYIYLDAANR